MEVRIYVNAVARCGTLYMQETPRRSEWHPRVAVHDDGARSINLLICTVMPRAKETGKRFCFDLVSPYRSYTLQARHLVTG